MPRRWAKNALQNALRIVRESYGGQTLQGVTLTCFCSGITESDFSDSISLSVALKRPERSLGGMTDSRVSSFKMPHRGADNGDFSSAAPSTLEVFSRETPLGLTRRQRKSMVCSDRERPHDYAELRCLQGCWIS